MMKDKSKRTILKSLYITNFMTILISTIVVATLIYFSLHNLFMDDISEKDKIIMESVSRNIEYFLTDAVDVLEYIDLIATNGETQNISAEMEKQNSIDQYFENIEILDLNGTVIQTLPGNAKELGHTRNGEEYFLQLKNKEIFWSKPFISSKSGNTTVVISVLKGQRIIVGFLNLSYLNEFTSKSATELGSNFLVSIIDSYGIYISNNDMMLVEQRRPIDNFDQIKSLVSYGGHNIIQRDDKEYLLLAKSISQTNWYIVVYDDYLTTFKSYHSMIYMFIALIIFSLLAYLAISYLRTSKISKNIRDFTYQTQKISEGNYAIMLPKQKYAEFQKLASYFDVMINALRQRDRELLNIAYHDSLTGLLNRAYLYNGNWTEEISLKKIGGLIYFDLDNFKDINDNYGHLFGDKLLVYVADLISEKQFLSGITARIGGDEFVIILSSEISHDDSEDLTRTILDVIQKPVELDGKLVHITASAGIAYSNIEEDVDISTLLKYADIALYEAKKMGKNIFKIFSENINNKVTRRLMIETQLRYALRKNEMHLVFQPQYTTSTNSIRGFEALLRWENDTIGTISPVEFIPIAEETGMIVEISRWVIKNACETIRQINETYQTRFNVSINVSPCEIRQTEFKEQLFEIVSGSGLEYQLVEIEITENVLLDNTAEVIATLEAIREKKIKISLDDFGTGYSSLSYLHKLPITTLKIDRSFVENMLTDRVGKRMVDSIIIMGHYLDLEIIAEGVENRLQVEVLSNLSCDCIQGYYYCKPLAQDALMDYLISNHYL